MKKLCIQVCEKAQLTIEVTPEMEIDFFECWDMAEHREVFKIAKRAAGMGWTSLAEHLPVRL